MMKRITTKKEIVLDLLEKGKLIDLVELRTGKNNSGSGINKINQLRIICKYFDIPLENHVSHCNTSKLRNRRNFFIFLNYLKRNNIQYIYAEKVLYFPVESEIADILRVYDNNWNAVYDSIVDCHLAEKESK